MSRRRAARGLRLLVCSLCLLSYLHPASADAPARSNRRPMRRVDAVATDQVEDRTNAIDQPLDQALQLKYYDVVSVDLVHRLPAGADPAPDTLTLVAAGAGEGAADPDQTSDAKVAPPTPTKPETAKTLADQVAEGKYGLIHRELFQRRPERLGILNYRRNEEVPLDDERNYGGLRPDEIWLAEDHLLVLKGGSIRHGSNRSGEPDAPAWQPIDDYRAPDRQVQIPANPAVPPPFPVQLRENGPIEFIRGRQVPAFNPFTNESAFLFTNKAFPVIRPEDFGGQHILAGPAAHNATGQHRPAGLQYPPPVNPPPVSDNRTYSNPFLKLPPPALYAGPPAGGSLDEARNRTAGLPPGLDEDDPSLYYPPPYTFEYRGNYTNPVPPGPLVPGIILPPPPNFFILKPAGGSNGTSVRPPTTTTTTDRPKGTKPPKQYVSVRPHPTTTVAPPPPPPPPPSVNSVAPAKIVPSRVEIQKAVLKTFVPVLEVYGAPPKPAKPAAKRPRPKPTVASVATATPAQTPSTKLHKIQPEQPAGGQRQPVYAEYFDVRTSTVRPPVSWSDVGVPAGTPQLPRTYLPVGKVEQARPVAPPDYLAGPGYGYSPIEQFHREVQTIRQTLQIYEKANRLSGKGGRTSKAHQHHQQQHPQPSLANLSLSFDGNVYRTLFPEEVALPPQQVPSGPSYHRQQQQQHHQPQPYKPAAYEPTYVYRPTANSVLPPVDLPTGYYVTSTDYGRHGYADAAAQSHPQYYQPTAPPPPPPQPDLSYIAPVILNNGASGYNRRPDFDPSTTTTTKSYLILDHRLQRPQPPAQPPLSPYLYRSTSGGGGGVSGSTIDGQQGVTGPVRNRYLDGDILVNYKHPLPVLNPDSEFLPYHHRLKVRKRQNVRGAGEQKPRYHGQPLYNHR
ncbi:proline-rich extensin-like protein EPR1 isoform X2 [Anopheles arabiensis]|uniref:Uncharacterized protein n=1 Tax=Anopheles arabiensis TaxID=7173 RepID=A0A182IAI3_ANOAR|nr:proline-rich extensin-like protein EPR1 isoform X2 [Anopheles arabiensis]